MLRDIYQPSTVCQTGNVLCFLCLRPQSDTQDPSQAWGGGERQGPSPQEWAVVSKPHPLPVPACDSCLLTAPAEGEKGGTLTRGSISTSSPPQSVVPSKPTHSCASPHIHHPLWSLPVSWHSKARFLTSPLCLPPPITFPVPWSPKASLFPPSLPPPTVRRPVSQLPVSRAQTSSLPGLPGDKWGSGRLPLASQGGGPHPGRPPEAPGRLTRKPAAQPPSPTPDRVAWEEKSSSHLLSCRVSGLGGPRDARRTCSLSRGSAPCPAGRKDTGLSSPVMASGTLEP